MGNGKEEEGRYRKGNGDKEKTPERLRQPEIYNKYLEEHQAACFLGKKSFRLPCLACDDRQSVWCTEHKM